MEFRYDGYFYVDELSLDDMANEIKEGASLDEIYDDWVSGLEDVDYFTVDYVEDDIKKEILRRAKNA